MSRTGWHRLAAAAALGGLCYGGALVSAQQAGAAMTLAAERFLGSLTPELRAQAVLPMDAGERQRWHFVPTEMFPRKGLPIKAMSADQRARAHDLLRAGLSQAGYATVNDIIALEEVLAVLEKGGRFNRDPEGYLLSIFGTPSASGRWGWRFEGHHLSMHFTVEGGRVVADAPTFAGANPAEVRSGPQRGKRALGAREDVGRALVEALTAEQRRVAIITDVAPNDIVTGNALDIEPLAPAGIFGSALTDAQRALLIRVIETYTSMMASDVAAARLARVTRDGLGAVTFAWAGPIEKGARHYYRVQGPSFLIEYDNTQNDGNHIHSVWRDFAGDFGRDLLREHLRDVVH
ncbi:MAG: DUF3500 domain-containing protein [Acidobacteriota bacterium]